MNNTEALKKEKVLLTSIFIVVSVILGILISTENYKYVLAAVSLFAYLIFVYKCEARIAYAIILTIPLNWVAIEIGSFSVSVFDMTIILGIAYLIAKLLSGKISLHLGILGLLIILFLIISALSIFMANDKTQAFVAMAELLKSFSLYLVISSLLRGVDEIRNALLLNSVIATLVATVGISQYLLYGSSTEVLYRVESFFHNPNLLANYMLFSIPLTIYIASRYRGMKRAILIFFLIIMFSCIITTFSRGGNLALIASLLSFLLISKRRRIEVFAVVLIIAVVFVSYLSLSADQTLVSSWNYRLLNPSETTTETRLDLSKAALEMMKENPILGVGIGNFVSAKSQYGYGYLGETISHNVYLETGAQVGIVGLALFLLLIIMFMYRTLSDMKGGLEGVDVFLLASLLASFIGLLVQYGFFSGYKSLFWVVIALGSAVHNNYVMDEGEERLGVEDSIPDEVFI